MRYTIYQTINQINGKIYIGKHQTQNPNDGYMGSGIALQNAIKKYGINNFKKIILFDFDTEYEMNLKECEIVTEAFIKRKDTYNKGIGGEGGPHFKGRTHTIESRKKMGKPGRVLTDDVKQKISESNKKRIISDETKKKLSEKAQQRTHNIATKIKISEAIKKHYEGLRTF